MTQTPTIPRADNHTALSGGPLWTQIWHKRSAIYFWATRSPEISAALFPLPYLGSRDRQLHHESDELMDPVSLSKRLPVFMLWLPHLQKGNGDTTDFRRSGEDVQDGLPPVA